MANYTLWGLNRAVDFAPRLLTRFARHHRVTLGQRGPTHNRGVQSQPGALMHEGPTHDEYFVPIPVKCIGEPTSNFWQTLPIDRTRLFNIAAASPAMEVWEDYWQTSSRGWCVPTSISPAFGDVTMNTQPHVGLYQILHDNFRSTGAKNVLVGYSQGGLVARFLAYLDEHVVQDPQQRCIEAVVTVQAPNRGSPLASAGHGYTVLPKLLLAALSVPGLLPMRGAQPIWGHLNALGTPDVLGHTMSILDNLHETLKAQTPTPGQLEFIRTARKWSSGIAGVQTLAFYDLDPARLDEKHTVLSVLHPTPTSSAHATIKHGSVVGTNGVLIDFIDSVERSALPRWFSNVQTPFFKLGYRLVRRAIKDAIMLADEIYRLEVMGLPPAPTLPKVAQLRSEISSGFGSQNGYRISDAIGSHHHDFIIPAASQVLLPGAQGSFLGNLVNADAGHLSGAEITDASPNSVDLIGQLLRQL